MSEIGHDDIKIHADMFSAKLPGDRKVSVGIAYDKNECRVGYAVRFFVEERETKLLVSDEAWAVMVALGERANSKSQVTQLAWTVHMKLADYPAESEPA